MDARFIGVSWPIGYSRNFYPRLERFTLAPLVYLVFLLYPKEVARLILSGLQQS